MTKITEKLSEEARDCLAQTEVLASDLETIDAFVRVDDGVSARSHLQQTAEHLLVLKDKLREL